MEKELFYCVKIFIERCEKSKLHAYETTERDGEECLICDYNFQNRFSIAQSIDEETDEITYSFIDYHDTDGVYDKCDLKKALKTVKEASMLQGVCL